MKAIQRAFLFLLSTHAATLPKAKAGVVTAGADVQVGDEVWDSSSNRAATTTTVTSTAVATTIPPAETTTPATITPETTPTTEGGKDCFSVFCEMTLTDGYMIGYKVNEPEGTVSIEVLYDGEAWVGIAFSEDEKMGGSDAVIGSPDSGIPMKYRLNQGSIEIMSPEEQTLTDADVEFIGGQTAMKFTKLMKEEGEIEITTGVNKMLWANGGDTTTIGYHGPTNRSPFSLNLGGSTPPLPTDSLPPITATLTSTAVATTIPPAETTTPATITPPETTPTTEGGKDCFSVFCETTLTDGFTLSYKVNEPEGTVSMEATLDGEAWVGIAFSEDERMGGSDGILGSPDSGIPQKYRLSQGFIEIMSPEEQTLTKASVEVNEIGQTVMKFTKLLVEANEIPITPGDNNMLWANGGDTTTIGYHGPTNRAPVKINLSSGAAETVSAANMGAWLAHGICGFIAWGVLAPTAVNSAIYRSLFKGPFWFKLHQFFNFSAYALTIIAFIIAAAFISKEGNPHWFSSHAKMGLSMCIIASVQVLWGAARPHLPGPDSGDEKTTIRKVWEIKHRLTGTVLLACGFWQMSAGIKLFAFKYNGVGSVQEQGVTIAYWIWVGIEVALLLIGGVYFKLVRKPVEDVDGNDAGIEGDNMAQDGWVEDAV